MSTDHARLAELLGALQSTLQAGGALEAPLDRLLELLGARGTGIWRLQEAELVQVGFRGVTEMPAHVRTAFAEATRRVPLGAAGLGIVRAVQDRAPAVATVQPEPGGLHASAGWLERMGAVQSLAWPLFADAAERDLVGVLAISTARALTPASPAWQQLGELARGLGPALAEWAPR